MKVSTCKHCGKRISQYTEDLGVKCVKKWGHQEKGEQGWIDSCSFASDEPYTKEPYAEPVPPHILVVGEEREERWGGDDWGR